VGLLRFPARPIDATQPTEKRSSMNAVDHIADRRELARHQPEKSTRWPRTERRQQRITRVLSRRQPDLTVVLENVHDPHNVSAVLRSCDAVGVLEIHLVYTTEAVPIGPFARRTSASAAKWIDTSRHSSVEACYGLLRAGGFAILATAMDETSRSIHAVDFCRPTAIVFGNEMRGVSSEAGEMADGRILIPMMGMVQSLNISVACAVTLYEALRQRTQAGHYDRPKLDESTLAAIREDWLRR
jgi:tRNA (guanosine-2'-O-)-methyltransferase